MDLWAQFDHILQNIGIIAGLLFTAVSLRAETKTRQIANMLAVTQNHRDIWQEIFRRPELQRVLDVNADLEQRPITREEEIFVNLVILHLNSVFQAMKDKLIVKPEGLQKDVGSFFTLPIPKAVWNEMKVLHEDDFIKFVESCWIKR